MFFRFVSAFLMAILLKAESLPQDKQYGVEFNPFGIITIGGPDSYLSGTLSYFDHKRGIEIAFPVQYYREDENYKQYTLDMHYRKFLSQKIEGVYYSGFVRLANIKGNNGDLRIKQTKFGAGIGVGVRYFFSNGFYWGAALGVGAYLTKDNDNFTHHMFSKSDDPRVITDIELLKIGYSF